MKNFISNFTKADKLVFKSVILIFVIFMIFSLSSCTTLKKTHESTTVEKEFKDSKKDSVVSINTNQKINDRVVQQVPSFDYETNKRIDAILSALNTSKQSGSNGYNQRYDIETRQLITDFIIGQTQDKEVETTTETKVEKSFEQNVDDYIKKTTFPWWIYIIAIFLLWPSISKVLVLVFPTNGLVNAYKRKLFNRPDKEM